ncbi:hypothetical protein [Methylocaldum sp.]|uniref:hypothetical protein n=1 Tax=Methylocaldum sp. TaxID=1969727 RepID=UPI002D6A8628|nr:hypothetical protein [Methylocaldum sp.]HYE35661.1 hypothetical protein [Methylocaldum sp.]
MSKTLKQIELMAELSLLERETERLMAVFDSLIAGNQMNAGGVVATEDAVFSHVMTYKRIMFDLIRSGVELTDEGVNRCLGALFVLMRFMKDIQPAADRARAEVAAVEAAAKSQQEVIGLH